MCAAVMGHYLKYYRQLLTRWYLKSKIFTYHGNNRLECGIEIQCKAFFLPKVILMKSKSIYDFSW